MRECVILPQVNRPINNVVWCVLIGTILFTSGIVGCKSNQTIREESQQELEQATEGNFILYVSNQSGARSPVDIEILVDGQVAVRDEFHHEDGHHRLQYQFQLSDGQHVLTAISEKGRAHFEEQFTITGTHWAVCNYFYAPGKKGVKIDPVFTFNIDSKSISFH